MTTGLESLGLLVGHMVGDFIVQGDWQAANKGNPCPGWTLPGTYWLPDGSPGQSKETPELLNQLVAYRAAWRKWWGGNLACTVHCLLYTLAVWACSSWWMPWWGLLVCFLTHWPIDRFRLAGRWMRNISHQKAFATGPLAPWSIIVVDQCMHIVVLFAIARCA